MVGDYGALALRVLFLVLLQSHTCYQASVPILWLLPFIQQPQEAFHPMRLDLVQPQETLAQQAHRAHGKD